MQPNPNSQIFQLCCKYNLETSL